MKNLRDYILDTSITEEDTIVLNKNDFDKIVLEYRDTYNESIEIPFLIMGVLVKEDEGYNVYPNQIKVVKNDIESLRLKREIEPDLNDPIYRCGWCGNVVDFDGKLLSHEARQYNINLIEKYSRDVIVKTVHGACCTDRYNS